MCGIPFHLRIFVCYIICLYWLFIIQWYQCQCAEGWGVGWVTAIAEWPYATVPTVPLPQVPDSDTAREGEKVVGSNFWLVSGHFLPTSQLTNHTIVLTLPVLRHFLTKDKGYTDFWKTSKPCHVGIHWKALAEYSRMNNHAPRFQSFFRFSYHFVSVKLATSSIKDKMAEHYSWQVIESQTPTVIDKK